MTITDLIKFLATLPGEYDVLVPTEPEGLSTLRGDVNKITIDMLTETVTLRGG